MPGGGELRSRARLGISPAAMDFACRRQRGRGGPTWWIHHLHQAEQGKLARRLEQALENARAPSARRLRMPSPRTPSSGRRPISRWPSQALRVPILDPDGKPLGRAISRLPGTAATHCTKWRTPAARSRKSFSSERWAKPSSCCGRPEDRERSVTLAGRIKSKSYGRDPHSQRHAAAQA
jgi:hypothetical protein